MGELLTNFLFFLFLIDRCTLVNNCPLNSWQQDNNQCTQIVNVQPLKASVDNSQWVCLLSFLVSLNSHSFFFFFSSKD
jgi:hypothetical protein